MAKKKLDPKLQAWVTARQRHHLSHAHVQMARELGMNPAKLGGLDNHGQEPWKLPLPEFIEHLYEKRFGKSRPDVVTTLEERARLAAEKEAVRKAQKQERRAARLAAPSSVSIARSRHEEGAHLISKAKKLRVLLVTTTNEPFQPVRLYYAIPNPALVAAKLRALSCIVEVAPERCWQWLFAAEAASLSFAGGRYDDVPKEKRPIIIGRIRFPAHGGMTFETNSIPRAIEGARFFGSRLGPEVVAIRYRVVNRCFAAEEGRPDELAKLLDRDVTVIDPRASEAAFRREFEGVRSMKDAERAAAESLDRRIKNGDDVPLVEDFPLVPEEETPDFRDLATGLQFRFVRAFEHWQGNTDLTLAAIIRRTVEQNMRARGASQ
jgi:hypothetical protein